MCWRNLWTRTGEGKESTLLLDVAGCFAFVVVKDFKFAPLIHGLGTQTQGTNPNGTKENSPIVHSTERFSTLIPTPLHPKPHTPNPKPSTLISSVQTVEALCPCLGGNTCTLNRLDYGRRSRSQALPSAALARAACKGHQLTGVNREEGNT